MVFLLPWCLLSSAPSGKGITDKGKKKKKDPGIGNEYGRRFSID